MVVNWNFKSQYSCVYVFVYHLQSCYCLKKSFLRLVSPTTSNLPDVPPCCDLSSFSFFADTLGGPFVSCWKGTCSP
jgi:hypothetical protein